MNFGILESQRMCWQEVLAIGKTVVHDGRRCHIAGMTRGMETKLYIEGSTPAQRKTPLDFPQIQGGYWCG